MKKATLEIVEKKQELPVLIIDKEGNIGGQLAHRLSTSFQVVFVGLKPLLAKHIAFVLLRKKMPRIPAYEYSCVFVFCSGEESESFLDACAQKAREDDAVCVFALHYSFYDKHFVARLSGSYRSAFVIVYGDYFGEESIVFPSRIDELFFTAKVHGNVVLVEDGTNMLFPIFFEDVIAGLIRVGFGSRLSKKIFFLFPKVPVTELTIVRTLRKEDPLIRIDFSSKSQNTHDAFVEGEYLLSDSYPTTRKIREAFRSYRPTQKQLAQAKKKKLSHRNKTQQDTKMWYIHSTRSLFLFFLFFLLFPFLFTGVFTVVGIGEARLVKHAFERGDVASSFQAAKRAKDFFHIARGGEKIVSYELDTIGAHDATVFLSDFLSSAEDIAHAVCSSLDAFSLYSRIFNKKSPTPKEDFSVASSQLKSAFATIQNIGTENKRNSLERVLRMQFDSRDTFLRLKEVQSETRLLANTIDILPSLIGFEGKRSYLVLFQNNMELRPGGGFIGSYGLLDFDQGGVTNFAIHNVYDADGQLRGHVEPPFAIRRYLPSVHWFLRDSNFDVDFPKAASSAAYLLFLETKKTVDGVIGVDVSFARELVGALGSVYVPQYNETVTKDNMYKLTQQYAEKGSFAGSTQKRDFLKALFEAMERDLSSRKDIPYLRIAQTVTGAIAQKHVVVAFGDEHVEKLFAVNGMSATIVDEREDGENKIRDFVGISEANLGVNKANYFVRRKVKETVVVDSNGKISSVLTIVYKNTSKQNSWPGREYKVYIRALLPHNAMLTGIRIDGKTQQIVPAVTDPLVYEAKGFVPPTGLEVEKKEEDGKTLYGFLTIVSTGAYQSIEISYTLNNKISFKDTSFLYDLRVFKQPGTDTYPFSFVLVHPQEFLVANSSDELARSTESLSFDGDLVGDKDFRISFTKQ